MKLFITTDCDSHYLGSVAVVLATDESDARELVDQWLRDKCLHDSKSKPYTLRTVDTATRAMVHFDDGDY